MAKKNSVKSQLPELPEAEKMSALDPQRELGRILQHPPHRRTQAPTPPPPYFLTLAVLTRLNPLSLVGGGGLLPILGTTYYMILNQ